MIKFKTLAAFIVSHSHVRQNQFDHPKVITVADSTTKICNLGLSEVLL